MGGYSVFYLPEYFRQMFICRHKFYIEQAKERLLSQFNNIEEEANQYEKDYLEKLAKNCDPEEDYSSVCEDAFQESCCFYRSLEDMLQATRNMVIASMFHEWDKELRNWASEELGRLRWLEGKNPCKKIWSCNFDDIISFFETCEWGTKDKKFKWDIKSKGYYKSLDRCRLFTNAYKHGAGSALGAIKKNHKDLIKKSTPVEYITKEYSYDEHKNLTSEDRHIEEFSDAIIKFWEDVPEYMSLPS